MATTEERMMIMGLCLQGILANPRLTHVAENARRAETQLERNVQLAHAYADKLLPMPGVTDAERIAGLTRIAYEVLRAADADNAASWPPFEDARNGKPLAEDNLDGVFDRVARAFSDPASAPETRQDYLIWAVVRASQATASGHSELAQGGANG